MRRRDANLRKAATNELVRSKYIKVVHRTVMTTVILLNSQTTVGSHAYLSPLFIELWPMLMVGVRVSVEMCRVIRVMHGEMHSHGHRSRGPALPVEDYVRHAGS
jgi:hypothetical protein